MYNVLEKLRSLDAPSANGATPSQPGPQAQVSPTQDPPRAEGPTQPAPQLTEQELHIYNAGLIGTLRELHDQLDRAVFTAYDWPHDLTTEQILERVVVLNAIRRAEEASGLVRWLRPDYQAPNYVPVTATLQGFAPETVATSRGRQPWPANLPDQVRAIKDVMRSSAPLTPQQIASTFRPASRTRVTEILETLTALGQARADGDRYSI